MVATQTLAMCREVEDACVERGAMLSVCLCLHGEKKLMTHAGEQETAWAIKRRNGAAVLTGVQVREAQLLGLVYCWPARPDGQVCTFCRWAAISCSLSQILDKGPMGLVVGCFRVKLGLGLK